MSALLKTMLKPSLNSSGSLASFGSSGSLASLAELSPASSPRSPVIGRSPTPGWKELYNKEAGECRWPLPPPSKDTKDCEFVFKEPPIELDKNVQIVTIPAGTQVYHATTIYPKQALWFEGSTPFFSLPTKAMWFASSPAHAKHMNYTHVLQYTLQKDAPVLFIQNIATTFRRYGATLGKEMIRLAEFNKYVKRAETEYGIKIVGYSGCNECEIAIFKNSVPDIVEPTPEVLESRSIAFLTGGRRRKTIRKRKRRLTRSRR